MHVNAVVRTPAWRWWAVAATFARLPGNMAPLALIVSRPGSGGAISAAFYTGGIAIGATWRGRAIDRVGVRRGLRREGLLLAGASLLVFAAIAIGAPSAVIWGAAAVMGITGSAVGIAYRAALPTFVCGSQLSSAYTVDAVLTDVSFVASPLVVALLAATAPPDAQFLTASACAGASYLAGAALPAAGPDRGSRRADTTGWIAVGMPVFTITAVIGFGYGLLMAGLPARLNELGWSAATAATLFAVMSGTSAVTGVAVVVRGLPSATLRTAAALSVPFALGTALLAATPSPIPAVAGMALFGSGLAPLNGIGSKALSDRVPPGTLARAFSVYAAMITINSGIGFALAAYLLTTLGGTGALLASHIAFLALTISLVVVCLMQARDRRRNGPVVRINSDASEQTEDG